MDVSVEVDPENGVATCVVAGHLTVQAMKDTARLVWERPDFGRSKILWDLSAATFSLTSAEVGQLAQFAKAGSVLRVPARMAFVVSSDLEFGLVRMFNALRETPGIELGVFRDRRDATSWLDALRV